MSYGSQSNIVASDMNELLTSDDDVLQSDQVEELIQGLPIQSQEDTKVDSILLNKSCPPDISVSPQYIKFSPTFHNIEQEEKITLSNGGAIPEHFKISITGDDVFEVSENYVEIQPGENKLLILSFFPTKVDLFQASLILEGRTSFVIPVIGHCIPSPLEYPPPESDAWEFGRKPSTKSIKFHNKNISLTLDITLKIDCNLFKISHEKLVLPPLKAVEVTISFTPTNVMADLDPILRIECPQSGDNFDIPLRIQSPHSRIQLMFGTIIAGKAAYSEMEMNRPYVIKSIGWPFKFESEVSDESLAVFGFYPSKAGHFSCVVEMGKFDIELVGDAINSPYEVKISQKFPKKGLLLKNISDKQYNFNITSMNSDILLNHNVFNLKPNRRVNIAMVTDKELDFDEVIFKVICTSDGKSVVDTFSIPSIRVPFVSDTNMISYADETSNVDEYSYSSHSDSDENYSIVSNASLSLSQAKNYNLYQRKSDSSKSRNSLNNHTVKSVGESIKSIIQSSIHSVSVSKNKSKFNSISSIGNIIVDENLSLDEKFVKNQKYSQTPSYLRVTDVVDRTPNRYNTLSNIVAPQSPDVNVSNGCSPVRRSGSTDLLNSNDSKNMNKSDYSRKLRNERSSPGSDAQYPLHDALTPNETYSLDSGPNSIVDSCSPIRGSPVHRSFSPINNRNASPLQRKSLSPSIKGTSLSVMMNNSSYSPKKYSTQVHMSSSALQNTKQSLTESKLNNSSMLKSESLTPNNSKAKIIQDHSDFYVDDDYSQLNQSANFSQSLSPRRTLKSAIHEKFYNSQGSLLYQKNGIPINMLHGQRDSSFTPHAKKGFTNQLDSDLFNSPDSRGSLVQADLENNMNSSKYSNHGSESTSKESLHNESPHTDDRVERKVTLQSQKKTNSPHVTYHSSTVITNNKLKPSKSRFKSEHFHVEPSSVDQHEEVSSSHESSKDFYVSNLRNSNDKYNDRLDRFLDTGRNYGKGNRISFLTKPNEEKSELQSSQLDKTSGSLMTISQISTPPGILKSKKLANNNIQELQDKQNDETTCEYLESNSRNKSSFYDGSPIRSKEYSRLSSSRPQISPPCKLDNLPLSSSDNNVTTKAVLIAFPRVTKNTPRSATIRIECEQEFDILRPDWVQINNRDFKSDAPITMMCDFIPSSSRATMLTITPSSGQKLDIPIIAYRGEAKLVFKQNVSINNRQGELIVRNDGTRAGFIMFSNEKDPGFDVMMAPHSAIIQPTEEYRFDILLPENIDDFSGLKIVATHGDEILRQIRVYLKPNDVFATAFKNIEIKDELSMIRSVLPAIRPRALTILFKQLMQHTIINISETPDRKPSISVSPERVTLVRGRPQYVIITNITGKSVSVSASCRSTGVVISPKYLNLGPFDEAYIEVSMNEVGSSNIEILCHGHMFNVNVTNISVECDTMENNGTPFTQTTKLEFPVTVVGNKCSQELVIRNDSNSKISLSICSSTGCFRHPNSVTLDPKSERTVYIDFSPSSGKQYNDELIIQLNNIIQRIGMIGKGITEKYVSFEFPKTYIGSSKHIKVKVANKSHSQIMVHSESEEPFMSPSQSYLIGARSYVLLPITFTPKKSGLYFGTAEVKSETGTLVMVNMIGECYD